MFGLLSLQLPPKDQRRSVKQNRTRHHHGERTRLSQELVDVTTSVLNLLPDTCMTVLPTYDFVYVQYLLGYASVLYFTILFTYEFLYVWHGHNFDCKVFTMKDLISEQDFISDLISDPFMEDSISWPVRALVGHGKADPLPWEGRLRCPGRTRWHEPAPWLQQSPPRPWEVKSSISLRFAP